MLINSSFDFSRLSRIISLSSAIVLFSACGTPPDNGSSSSSESSSSSSISSSSSVESSSSSSSSEQSSESSSSSSSSAPSSVTVYADDFEDDSPGAAPANWHTFIGWVWDNGNSGDNYVQVDSSKSYSGSNSVHFKGGARPAQIAYDLPSEVTSGKKLYLAAMVWMSKSMGNEPGDNHEHIMGLKKTPDANNEIRFGQIKGHLGTNHIPSDDISPRQDQWYSGPQISSGAWHCVELDLRGDLSYNTLVARVDGVEVHKIDSAGDWNNGLSDAQWMADKFEYAMFGFHSFSGNDADVWMDDIQISTSPVSCQ